MPEETTSFVGRGTELALLERALEEHRLITLTGSGGVGKSRLALRAAERACGVAGRAEVRAAAPYPGDLYPDDPYPDGVWWADLAPLYDERMLLITVSDAVGLSDHSLRMPIDSLCEWLAHRTLLLVLDSCERMRTLCGRLVDELLTAAPGLTVLATSRQPLGIPAEHCLDVPPLSLDGGDGGSSGGSEYGADGPDGPDGQYGQYGQYGADEVLQLFRDRAAVAAPRVSLDDPATVASAVRICRRLEGIPLAVELACARLDENSVEQIAELLTSRLDTLTNQHIWPHRHRTLRTAIGWSHELCAPLERLLWARLAVFRGEIDEADARAVCSGGPLTADGVTQALAGLVAQSVLRRDGDRYRMLDTIREYGMMWLAELGEEKLLADRHAAHFAQLVARAHDGWPGPEQVAWYRRIAETHADLCAALNHLIEYHPATALEMAGGVAFFWSCCGHLHEARNYLERALAGDHDLGPHRTRALWALGVTVMLQGDHEGAYRIGERCTAAAWHDQDPESRLSAAYLVSLTCLMMGRPLAAHIVADRALRAQWGGAFDSPSQLRCRLVRVFSLTALGRLDAAGEAAAELRRACLARGECWTRAYADYQLALVHLLQGRPYEAEAYARAMVGGKEELGDSFGIALGLDLLAAAVAAQGDGERAAHIYGTGQAFWRRVGHPQRGTPELAQVRAECERQARAAAGNPAYEDAFHRGLVDDGVTGLARALRGHRPPEA